VFSIKAVTKCYYSTGNNKFHTTHWQTVSNAALRNETWKTYCDTRMPKINTVTQNSSIFKDVTQHNSRRHTSSTTAVRTLDPTTLWFTAAMNNYVTLKKRNVKWISFYFQAAGMTEETSKKYSNYEWWNNNVQSKIHIILPQNWKIITVDNSAEDYRLKWNWTLVLLNALRGGGGGQFMSSTCIIFIT
jgi:hypothetical protein